MNTPMNAKGKSGASILLGVVAACAFSVAKAGDVTYAEVPADVSAITVSGGTATMVGVDAFRHLRHWWTFDNASNLKAATVGDLPLTKYLDGTLIATNDVKRGAGAAYFSGAAYRVTPLPSFVTPAVTEPFTVSFWFKCGRGGSASSRVFYLGPYGAPAGNAARGTFLELMYTSDKSLRKFYWFEGAYRGNRTFEIAEQSTPMDRWVHVAICVAPNGVWQPDGSVSNATVTLYFDGVSRGTASDVLNTGDAPYLLFGTGYGPSSQYSQPVADTIYDEIMIFDKTLSADEVAWVAENTRPFEFSAGWDIAGDGILDIAGLQPQTVRGAGTVTTDEGLTLSPVTDSFFAGVVAGASLTLDASASATQTLASAASYTGTTTVASGTLKIDPARAFPKLKNSLVAYYSCDDPDKPGRDDSGNGNDLSCANSDASVTVAGSVAGGALHFPATGAETGGYASAGRLNGFAGSEDNSFIVAAWVRVDEHSYREGFFTFETSAKSGLRFAGPDGDHKLLAFGDTGNMGTGNAPENLNDGKWRHFALLYDAAPADGSPYYRLFIDGEQKLTGTRRNATLKHATAAFSLGVGPDRTASSVFKGAVDEVFVLNGADTADIATLYAYRRAEFDAANASAVLPSDTTLVVEAGATLVITNSVEHVKELRGAGTVYIASGASLEARRHGGFSGQIVGGGRFVGKGFMVIVK